MAQPRIGYIEKQGRDRDALVTLLRVHQMVPVPLSSPAEYIEIRATMPVDLLLFSVRSNDYTGLELSQKIQEISPTPLIIIADFENPVDRIIAYEAGCDDIVALPYHPKELVARLRACLRRNTG